MRYDIYCDSVSFMKEDGKIDFLEWIKYFECLMESLDIKLTHYGISYPGARGKLMKFSSIHKKIAKLDKDSITAIGLQCSSSQEEPAHFPLVYCCLSHHDRRKNVMTLMFDKDFMHSCSFNFEKIATDIVNEFNFDYGYGFKMQHKYGPSEYMHGVIYSVGKRSFRSEEERNRITNWMWGSEKVYSGNIRDVYEMNFLSKDCLLQQTEVGELKTWIKSSSKNGSLKKINDKIFLWSVELQEIERIRTALMSILVSEMDYLKHREKN